MGAPVSLLGQARAFARDYPRDQMPPGFLWDTVDFVPAVVDAPLTGRGRWFWGSADMDGATQSGILMPFRSGDQLLAATPTSLYQINETDYSVTSRGSTWTSLQNPVKYLDAAINFDAARTRPPQLWRDASMPPADSSHKAATVGCAYKAMLVSAGAPGEEHIVRFSVPNSDLTQAASFDVNSFLASTTPVTALASMRSMILVFHKGSVERIRGSIPPFGDVDKGDMFVESFLDNAGTKHPRSIAYYNDNIVFADEHGVHLTDGAVVRNLTSLGGIQSYWRTVYPSAESICASTYVNYYIVTLRHAPPTMALSNEFASSSPAPPPLPAITQRGLRSLLPPDLGTITPPPPLAAPDYNTTLVCDLDRRQWFRLSNINAQTLWSGGGTAGPERIWAGLSGYTKIARLGPMFYPDVTLSQIDGNDVVVRPHIETPWYRLGLEGRKRVRFAYLSYDVRAIVASTVAPMRLGYMVSPEATSYINSGFFPVTTGYDRRRVPVHQFPYGVGFYVDTTDPTSSVRIYDIALEAWAGERSRV